MPSFKRRRIGSARGSNHHHSTRGQSSRFRASSSGTSSVSQDEDRSSSMQPPPVPFKKRISIKSASSHVAAPPSVQNEDNPESGENESDIQERENEDSMDEIIMAVELKERGTIGCAYYIAREERLCMMTDISMAGLDMIDTLKIHVEPTSRVS